MDINIDVKGGMNVYKYIYLGVYLCECVCVYTLALSIESA